VTVSPTPAGDEHPVTAGTGTFTLTDELYQRLDLEPGVEPLLTADRDGGTHPVLWTLRHGRGRVVTSLLGHGPESLAHPSHRALLTRAGAWAARSLTTAGGPST
jgi:type 1 glutamine amidotransferase